MTKKPRKIRINTNKRTFLQYYSHEKELLTLAFRNKRSLNEHLKFIDGCEIVYQGPTRPRYEATNQVEYRSLESVKKEFYDLLVMEEECVI
jgi:hypothetical protein